MAINLDDIINGSVIDGEWNGTGVFDKLLVAVNKNIEMQHEAGRITGSEFANVYSNSIQSVLNQSIEYILRKDLIDIQILDTEKGIELKESQLLTDAKQRESIDTENTIKQAQNEKDLALKDKQIIGLDKENIIKTNQALDIIKGIELKDSQITSNTKEDLIKDKQALDIAKSTELKTQQIASMIKEDTIKQNDSVSTIALKNAQKDEVVKSGTRSDSELADKLSTSAKQRVILDKESLLKDNQISIAYAEHILKDKEAALIGLDNVVKNKEVLRASTPNYVYTPSYIKQ